MVNDAPNARAKLGTAITDFSTTALSRTFMIRTNDPSEVDHPDLRAFAVPAAWVAQLEDAVEVLEELVVDFGDDDRPADLALWVEDPLEVALSVVNANVEAADQELGARVTAWLAQDPKHRPIVRLVVLDPWHEQAGPLCGIAATFNRLARNLPGVGQRLKSHLFGYLDIDHRCRAWTGSGIEVGISRGSRRILLFGGRSG